MVTILLQAAGVWAFLVGSAWLGRRIRRPQGDGRAQRLSRISHLLFWLCLVLPGLVGLLSPGLQNYDRLLAVPPLPGRPLLGVVGAALLVGGLGLMVGANRALARLGSGAAAFLLTKRIVAEGVYSRSRNPMSLGFYMVAAGLGLAAGSTAVTVGALVIIAPVHVFNLWYFEEQELEQRFGEAYLEYKARTPFLLPGVGRRSRGRA